MVTKDKLFNALKALLKLMLTWLLILVLISVFELLYNGLTRTFPESIYKFFALSIWNGVVFWLKAWVFMLVIFIPLFFVKPKLASSIGIAFLILFSVLQLLLINYFNTALLPLGADLFGYTLADIKQTLGASSGLSLVSVLSIVLLLFVFCTILIFLPKRIHVSLPFAIALPVISLVAFILKSYPSNPWVNVQSEYDNNLSINKTDFFLTSSFNYFLPSTTDMDIYADSYIGQYEGEERSSTVFVYPDEVNYPFYHTNETPDVLTPYFKPIKSPPNIVILLVEGLGRAFTNDGAYLGNFTPYLDSLASQSLYWKNFLSGAGRTFGALPSVMGSMPFSKSGMLEMGAKMPDHLSLYSILKYNGYRSSFYYGGDASFDNMSYFLSKNKVSQVSDLNSIPTNYNKLPAKSNGFTWGFADDQVYAYYLNQRLEQAKRAPEVSVILTVATHDPFLIQNQPKYLKKFEQRMSTLGFDETKKSAYRNYESQYSSIMYADEAIRDFLTAYKKRAEYDNTIFIITGDHRMAEIPLRTKIDRFHVPLLIFSPLLNRTAQMESVSTHFDITPSVLAFLKKNTKLTIPLGASWIGDGLDTARRFRNIHSYPLIQTKTSMVDFIQGEYHLNGNQLFKLNSDLNETLVQDEERLNQLTNAFNNFKSKNDKIAQGGKLLPDSIIKKYKIR